MLNVNIKGTIKKILFMSEKSCMFIFETGEGQELEGTLIKDTIHLVDKIALGKPCTFKGNITLNKKATGGNMFYKNVFYVNDIQPEQELTA